MAFTASHGFTQVDTWPVSTAGVDLRRPGNHLQGPVSLFSHGSREPFMGVYHPRLRAGVAHWADPAALPSKKVWSWGADADGRGARRRLAAWAPGGGRNPRFAMPLLLPSLLAGFELGTHDGLPAYAGSDALFEGRAVVRLRSRSGRPTG
jgi:hypothetical protein